MTETPGAVVRRSPLLGEDTCASLRELGLSEEDIQSLIERRIVVAAKQIERKDV
jgi:crotonobetainyl-CoA:carnitine CoA-transferase CaiB-like acyl-CoA transferase